MSKYWSLRSWLQKFWVCEPNGIIKKFTQVSIHAEPIRVGKLHVGRGPTQVQEETGWILRHFASPDILHGSSHPYHKRMNWSSGHWPQKTSNPSVIKRINGISYLINIEAKYGNSLCLNWTKWKPLQSISDKQRETDGIYSVSLQQNSPWLSWHKMTLWTQQIVNNSWNFQTHSSAHEFVIFNFCEPMIS